MAAHTVPFLFTLLVLLSGCSQPNATGQLTDGKLRPCPDSPNCVSSESGSTHHIPPIPYTESEETAWQNLQTCIVEMGGKIIAVEPNYMWVTFTSKIFRFVDDVELRMNRDQKIIHIRSGSRVGYMDFGVNKKRTEKIRTFFSNY